MTMTVQEQKEVRAYCAFLLTEYGIHISPNDPTIPALYTIYRHTKSNIESNCALASEVQEALQKMKPEEFHFHHPGEAWKFQLGAAVKWILIGLIILLFTWVGVWYWSMVKDLDRARTIIEASGPMGEFLKAAQQDKDGYYFIDFNAPKGDSIQNFKEFRKLNSKTVRVYLGKD